MRRWYQYPVNKVFTVANQESVVQQLITADYNFVVQKLVHYTTTEDYRIQLLQGNRLFQQSFIYSPSVFGTIQYPNILLTPLIFLKNSAVDFKLFNGATAANNIQAVMEGYLTDEPVDLTKQWFQYPFETITFTGAAEQQTKTLLNSSGYNFIIQKMVAKSDAAFRTRMIDANELWQNDYVQNISTWGIAQRPNILQQPIFVPKNAGVSIQFINGSTAANIVQCVFEGYLIP